MAITKVTNSLVATNAIQGTLIADNAITSVHIAQNQVTAVQIPDGSITSTQLAANSVDTAELISGSIDAIHLASDSVITAKILNANVTTAKIANNAITSALIPDGSITNTQLGSGAFTMGTITTTGQIRGPASLTLDPATVGDNTGTVVIAGNLQVDGTTTTINSTTLNSADKNITLGFGANASANNGGGITIAGADATILYTHSGTKWSFNKPLDITGAITSSGIVQGTSYKIGSTLLVGTDRSLRSIPAIHNSSDTKVIDLANATYTILNDPEGNNRLFLGDSGDAGNYHNNTIHYFRNTAAAQQVLIQDTTLDLKSVHTITKASGDLTIDVGGDIILDADGGDIYLNDGGTGRGQISMANTDLAIVVATSDRDLIFKGVDGSSVITALTLDMSAAGAATFNNGIKAGADVAAFGANTGSSANRMAMSMEGSGVSRLICNGADVNTNGTFEVFTANSSGTGSAKLTVDASGNLLVGKPSQVLSTEGISISPTGYIQITETNSPPLYLNRKGTDGTIINFYKDTGSFGSIGVRSSTLQIGTGNTQFACSDADDAFFVKNEAGTARSGSHDLGKSNAKFKDLHLSSAVLVKGATPYLMVQDSDTSNSGVIEQAGTDLYYGNSSSSGTHIFKNNSSNGGRPSVNGTELMRMNSTGELHITSGGAPISPTFKHEGTTGDVAKIRAINRSGQAANKGGALELGGIVDDGVSRSDVFAAMAGLKTNSTSNNKEGYLALYTTNNSALNEQMRIDSSGNATFGKNEAAVSTAGFTIGAPASGVTSSMPSGNTYHVYKTGSSAGYKFYVSNLGVIHSTQTTINGLSDERLKENIADLETGLSEVMALKPRRFDWKNGDGKNLAGFIAQEVETVLPDLIADFKHEELKDCKSLKMGDMMPTLVKAIQELTTKVKELEDKLNG